MMGISWSGFNSLQVAALRPPALAAIITACSTDDRYDNDVHYLGGCPLGYYLLPWASVMLGFNARPPEPAIVGERWREMWRERLDGNVDLAATVAAPPAPRRLLAPRLDLRGLLGDPVPGVRRRRLGRRLRRRDLPDARAASSVRGGRSSAPGAISGRRTGRPGSRDRLPAGGAALVGPLAQGRRQRHHGRAAAARLDGGRRAPRRPTTTSAPAAGSPRRLAAGARAPRRACARARRRRAAAMRPGRAAAAPRQRRPSASTRAPGAPYGDPADMPTDQRREDALSLSFDTAPLAERLELLGQPRR